MVRLVTCRVVAACRRVVASCLVAAHPSCLLSRCRQAGGNVVLSGVSVCVCVCDHAAADLTTGSSSSNSSSSAQQHVSGCWRADTAVSAPTPTPLSGHTPTWWHHVWGWHHAVTTHHAVSGHLHVHARRQRAGRRRRRCCCSCSSLSLGFLAGWPVLCQPHKHPERGRQRAHAWQQTGAAAARRDELWRACSDHRSTV